ncbi:hypothetical protein EGT49_08180 [Companilactobacillus suantsaicola]|uniref:CDP-glycerol--glycerophosphate glycerophosphotransferase n=1 Tax=Companilactobacillus suantsaicola TaxID=2487723 RepID=A0A4Z0JKB3_9LACO|nr:CDP-glycerol glycerophosphotransferase family protein [Companilactobacillus suantsaicola]TGD22748.1 hypothetical protein EGT49_08180 [Companilactobacillus suantsaicola]
MIKNVFLKNLLINSVFKLFSNANQVIPKNNHQILIYSDLGFRDNVKYLYDYLISEKYNDYYKIICSVKGHEKFVASAPKNVKFVNPFEGIKYYFQSGHVFYCFGKLPIRIGKKQNVIQMWHGTSFKGFATNMTNTSSKADQFYSYVYSSSDYFQPIVKKKFNCSDEKIIVCGHPRTDVFYQKNPKYDLGEFKKIIMWMPTFRKSKFLGQNDGFQQNVVPFLKDDELKRFDKYLSDIDVKVIVKLHPMQDIKRINTSSFHNLILMTNDYFESKGYDLYRFLKCTDALITDYSSVFYDYLLLNRPIGFTEDDVDEYKNSRGFAVDPEKFRPGMKIKSINDLKKFIENVVANNDEFENSRVKINNLSNRFQDGHNCQRTLEISGIHKS